MNALLSFAGVRWLTASGIAIRHKQMTTHLIRGFLANFMGNILQNEAEKGNRPMLNKAFKSFARFQA